MLKRILSISGRPGLFRLVSQGKNMLIVESLQTGKRTPAYAHDKVVSLGDIAIYATEEDTPLSKVFEMLKEKANGNPIDLNSMDASQIRIFFKEVMPDFDEDRVHTSDIKKIYSWYNQLLTAGITDFSDKENADGEAGENAEKPEE